MSSIDIDWQSIARIDLPSCSCIINAQAKFCIWLFVFILTVEPVDISVTLIDINKIMNLQQKITYTDWHAINMCYESYTQKSFFLYRIFSFYDNCHWNVIDIWYHYYSDDGSTQSWFRGSAFMGFFTELFLWYIHLQSRNASLIQLIVRCMVSDSL
jgi:hypothetical protein